MSTLKTNKAQLGQSGTATQNFTLTAEAADGTMKLARGNAGATTQDILTIDAAGKPDFNQLARTLATNGECALPGGLLLKWGFVASRTAGVTSHSYTNAFPTACVGVFLTERYSGAGSHNDNFKLNSTPLAGSFEVHNDSTYGFNWIAIGY